MRFAILAAGLVLTGCQSIQIETAIRDNLPRACEEGKRYVARYEGAVASGRLQQSRSIDAAIAQAAPYCADPEKVVNVARALKALYESREVIAGALAAIR